MNTHQKQFLIKNINIKSSLSVLAAGIALLQLTGCALIGLNADPDQIDRMDQNNQNTNWTSENSANPSHNEDARIERERQRRLAIQNQDIFLGMSAQDVKSAWGSPRDVETAGMPGSGNERWVYYNGNSMSYGLERPRIVYFEQGHVVGWESANR